MKNGGTSMVPYAWNNDSGLADQNPSNKAAVFRNHADSDRFVSSSRSFSSLEREAVRNAVEAASVSRKNDSSSSKLKTSKPTLKPSTLNERDRLLDARSSTLLKNGSANTSSKASTPANVTKLSRPYTSNISPLKQRESRSITYRSSKLVGDRNPGAAMPTLSYVEERSRRSERSPLNLSSGSSGLKSRSSYQSYVSEKGRLDISLPQSLTKSISKLEKISSKEDTDTDADRIRNASRLRTTTRTKKDEAANVSSPVSSAVKKPVLNVNTARAGATLNDTTRNTLLNNNSKEKKAGYKSYTENQDRGSPSPLNKDKAAARAYLLQQALKSDYDNADVSTTSTGRTASVSQTPDEIDDSLRMSPMAALLERARLSHVASFKEPKTAASPSRNGSRVNNVGTKMRASGMSEQKLSPKLESKTESRGTTKAVALSETRLMEGLKGRRDLRLRSVADCEIPSSSRFPANDPTSSLPRARMQRMRSSDATAVLDRQLSLHSAKNQYGHHGYSNGSQARRELSATIEMAGTGKDASTIVNDVIETALKKAVRPRTNTVGLENLRFDRRSTRFNQALYNGKKPVNNSINGKGGDPSDMRCDLPQEGVAKTTVSALPVFAVPRSNGIAGKHLEDEQKSDANSFRERYNMTNTALLMAENGKMESKNEATSHKQRNVSSYAPPKNVQMERQRTSPINRKPKSFTPMPSSAGGNQMNEAGYQNGTNFDSVPKRKDTSWLPDKYMAIERIWSNDSDDTSSDRYIFAPSAKNGEKMRDYIQTQLKNLRIQSSCSHPIGQKKFVEYCNEVWSQKRSNQESEYKRNLARAMRGLPNGLHLLSIVRMANARAAGEAGLSHTI